MPKRVDTGKKQPQMEAPTVAATSLLRGTQA